MDVEGAWAAGPLGRWAAGPLGRWAAGPIIRWPGQCQDLCGGFAPRRPGRYGLAYACRQRVGHHQPSVTEPALASPRRRCQKPSTAKSLKAVWQLITIHALCMVIVSFGSYIVFLSCAVNIFLFFIFQRLDGTTGCMTREGRHGPGESTCSSTRTVSAHPPRP